MEIFSSLQTIPLSLFICIIVVLFSGFKWVSFDSKKKKNLPPSPPKLPIIGNFHQLGSRPNVNLHKMSQKYGPLMLLHFGSIPTLVASTADAAKQIMKTHDLLFCSRPSLTLPNILLYGSKTVGFAPYGEYWRQLKSLVVLKLLSNTRVKSYQKVRESEICDMIRVLGESSGAIINLQLLLISLTNDIICRAALGRKFDGLEHTHVLKRFMEMISFFSLGDYIPWLSWVDRITGTIQKAEKVAKDFDNLIEEVIEDHVNKKKLKNGISESDEGEDFVDILLDIQKDKTTGFTFNRDTLKALILEAFVAGTETTQTSLEWTMCELIKNPRVMKKLQKEVTAVTQGRSMVAEEDLEKMPYLKAVVKESLRLHSPATLLIPRITTQDVKLMGYDIAAGTQVLINAWAIGRDPDLWEDAYEFRPERFFNNSTNSELLQFKILAFGAGRRSCPGMSFSVCLMELALANIVYKFDMALPNGIKCEDLDMTDEFGVTVHLKSPLQVVVSPRF